MTRKAQGSFLREKSDGKAEDQSMAEYLKYRQAVTTEGTVAWVIERFIDKMTETRPLGRSHEYTLRRLQRAPVGSKVAVQMSKADVIAHCRLRAEAGVKPQTVMHDITYLAGALKYAGSDPDWQCDDVSDAAIAAAKPFLTKHNLICKSAPRERRPTTDERERLCAYFAERNKSPRTKVDMVRMTLWQVASGRRVGESCRLLWEDWNRDEHTILVRKMKDPRNRNKSKVVALPDEAQALLLAWSETRDPAEPQILPYKRETVIQNYVEAKKKLGISGLRLHDSRRETISRLAETGYTVPQIKLVSGHEGKSPVLERVYMKPDPATFKNGPMVARAAP